MQMKLVDKIGNSKIRNSSDQLPHRYSGRISPPDVSAACPRPLVSSVWSVRETWARLVQGDHNAENAPEIETRLRLPRYTTGPQKHAQHEVAVGVVEYGCWRRRWGVGAARGRRKDVGSVRSVARNVRNTELSAW